MIVNYHSTSVYYEEIYVIQPPLPPINENEDKESSRELIAVLYWEGNSFYVVCKSRRFNPQFSFKHPELGEVIYSDDQQTLLYSQKQLHPDINLWMQQIIKAWVKSYNNY